MTIPDWLRRWLLSRAAHIISKRPPDFVIGEDYLSRWFVIPRNRLFNVYLHVITGDDDDRAYHDHPWANLSIVLRGTLQEHMPAHIGELEADHVVFREPGAMVLRRATAMHRLSLIPFSDPVWTLFITGPKLRTWGFACPQGWRPWYEFVSPDDTGKVGRGCD